MKDRIKKIRIDAGLTQQKFADKLGIKRNTVATYETTNKTPMESIITSICREFNVNKDWLLSGTGEPYLEIPENNLIASAAQLLGQRDPILEAFLETYSQLNPANKEAIINFGLKLLNNIDEHSKK